MGLLKLFTNPAGWAMDKVKDKVTDKVASFGGPVSKVAGSIGKVADGGKRGNFISGVVGAAGEDSILGKFDNVMEKVESKTGIVSEKLEGYREKAMGGGPLRDRIMQRLDKIEDRELPEVDEYKPAGKAAEWMNRLGAGLYAAGGGNPEDIYANFRNKEMVKQERHQRQVELRQSALERQDEDVLNVLMSIEGRDQAAAGAIAGDLAQQETGMVTKALDLQSDAIAFEAENQRHLMDIQVSYDQQRIGFENQLMLADKQGQMQEDQVRLAAEIQMRNNIVAEISGYGLNPASFENTIKSYATGDWDSMSPVDHQRMAMISRLRKATTDEEARNIKLDMVTRLIGTRVMATDSITGEPIINPQTGEPLYTTLMNGEQGATYLMGGAQEAADAFSIHSNKAVGAEESAIAGVLEQGGQMNNPFTGPGRRRAADNISRGFPTTEDASVNQMENDPRDAPEQAARIGEMWSDAAAYMDGPEGGTFLDVVKALKRDGIHPEVIQGIVTQAINQEYWDGNADADEINALLMGVPTGRGD